MNISSTIFYEYKTVSYEYNDSDSLYTRKDNKRLQTSSYIFSKKKQHIPKCFTYTFPFSVMILLEQSQFSDIL